jgi:positive regulator of sigma E activity
MNIETLDRHQVIHFGIEERSQIKLSIILYISSLDLQVLHNFTGKLKKKNEIYKHLQKCQQHFLLYSEHKLINRIFTYNKVLIKVLDS